MGQNHNRCRAMSSPIEDDMVALGSEITPTEFALYQNYPNPFNSTTTIDYDLTRGGSIDLTIFDLMGRRIRTLVYGNQKPGFKSVIWNATDDFARPVSAGLYFYKLETLHTSFTKKMLLLK